MNELGAVFIIAILCVAAIGIIGICAIDDNETKRAIEMSKYQPPKPEETALRDAANQSLQLNMMTLEAFRQMAEAAKRSDDFPYNNQK